MSRVNMISHTYAAPHPEPVSREAQLDHPHMPGSSSVPTEDYTSMGAEWEESTSTDRLVQQTLAAFQKAYPGVEILITDNLDEKNLSAVAASLGEGTHLVLSEEFLKKMKSSRESYEKGKALLTKLLGQLTKHDESVRAQGYYVDKDKAWHWSARPSLQDTENPLLAGGKNKENSSSLLDMPAPREEDSFFNRIHTNKVSLHIISSSFANLAGARTKGEVRTVMADTRRNIANLRLASCFGDDKERMKARAAISSMQKLLQRGTRKIRRIEEQELVRLREKRARRNQERKRALLLQQERRKMQAKQRSANEAIRKEGELEELNQAFRFHKYNRYDPEDNSRSVPAIPTVPLSSAIPAEGAAFAAPIAPADISISSFSVNIT